MNEHGGYLGVIGRRREQTWLFRDLAMGSGTRQMPAEYIEDLCSDLPPVVSSKEEVVLEEPPPSQCDGDASGVAPGGRLSPVFPHEDRLLDSDAAVASGRSGQAPGPAQDRGGSEKTQASPSSTMSRATPDYSRCPVGLSRIAATGCTSMQWCICHGMSFVRFIALCAIRHSAIRLYVRITYDSSISWSQRPQMSSTFS